MGNGTNLFDGFGSSANVPASKAVEYLTVFNGQIYAAVGQQESGSGNSLTIWRSSDLAQWTQVGATTFSANDIDCYSMVTDGTRLFAGTHASSGGPNIYFTTDGTTWNPFNGSGSGFNRQGVSWASHLGILNTNLFAGVLTNGGGQVWRRALIGGPSQPWSIVVDFATGRGLPNPAPGINAFYFYAVSNTLFMPAGNRLYQSTDVTGNSWVTNTQADAGFGDINNLNLSSLVTFNGYLYAPTHNTNSGGQLWRTPVANALANGPLPWTKVVDSGFGQGAQFSELHHIAQGLGYLWVSMQGPCAQVWRSSDGLNWTQSNLNGFNTNSPTTAYKPVVEIFNNAAVWGGGSGTPPTGAQVWTLGPLTSSPRLQLQPTGADALLSWPANALDFILETSPNLDPASWVTSTNTPSLTNGQWLVTVKPGAASLFFRLRRP